MSEFEGYQETGNTGVSTGEVHYETMPDNQPTATAYDPNAQYAAQAQPVAEASAVNPAGDAASKAAGAMNKLVDSIGKLGVVLIIAVTSLIYTIAAGTTAFGAYALYGYNPLSGYAFAVGIISLVTAIVYVVLLKLVPSIATNELMHRLFGWFFAVWWLAGTITGTFAGPFEADTGNGYFAAWGALLFSLFYLSMVSPIFKGRVEQMQKVVVDQSFADLIGLTACSVIELIAASAVCVACVGTTAYAVAQGVVSIVVCAVLIYFVKSGGSTAAFAQAFSIISIFLWVWWLVGFCVVTFGGPFTNVGNGYFASFGATFFATRLIRSTTLFKSMIAKMGSLGGGGNAAANSNATADPAATTYGEPQYGNTTAYEDNGEGLDF